MFKFLFGRKDTAVEVVRETQRETVKRALGEINEIVARLDPKPTLTFDPNTGAVSFALPEQMPDEAKALPAPSAAEVAGGSKPKAEAAKPATGAPSDTPKRMRRRARRKRPSADDGCKEA
jgi:hypothetical protein